MWPQVSLRDLCLVYYLSEFLAVVDLTGEKYLCLCLEIHHGRASRGAHDQDLPVGSEHHAQSVHECLMICGEKKTIYLRS